MLNIFRHSTHHIIMAFADDGIQKLHIILRSLSSSSSNTSNNNNNEINSNENSNDESVEYIVANYPGILDVNLTTFSTGQRVGFIVTITTLFLLSICGNIGTLYVNVRRKIRPFFRACLISLAISDLLSTVFLSVGYFSQITADYVQIWRLGPDMCGAVPFITTAAILASSITLVGIALDRYFAVMKAVIGFWNPGVVFCIVCMFVIWAAAIGIASPVFWIFSLLRIYILSAEDVVTTDATPGKVTPALPPIGPAATPKLLPGVWQVERFIAEQKTSYMMVKEQQLVMMCVSQDHHVGLYYAIVFAIIFIPSIVAFIWLNSIIAKKLWIRRHTVTRSKRHVKKMDSSKEQLNKSNKNLTYKATSNNIELINKDEKITTASNTLIAQVCNCQAGNSQSSTVPSSIAVTMGGGLLQTTQHPKETPVVGALSAASGKPTPNPPCMVSTNACSTRESRHIRMFTVIVLLMAVFLFFRSPAWIFLIMRMNGSYTKSVHWMLYFSLGILNLTSCVLNPVFYTFLAETIQFVMIVKVKVCDNWCGLRLLSRRKKSKLRQTNTESLSEKQPSSQCWLCGCCCNCCVLAEEQIHLADGLAMDIPPVQKPPQPLSSKDEKDEGVECSEESDSFHGYNSEYNQQIYTIYPVALISSSIASE